MHVESNSRPSIFVLSLGKTMLSLGNQVILKKFGRCDSLGNNQKTKWIIIEDPEDEEKEGWFYLQESKSGKYLKAPTKQTLTTDGMYFIFKAL